MDRRALSSDQIAPPFGRYSHGLAFSAEGIRLIVTSGQLGLAADGSIPDSVGAQADICFKNISAILAQEGAGPENVVRIQAFVTDRVHFPDYMAARDRWLANAEVLPTSTLLVVSGFTRPEFKVEVEVTAAIPNRDGTIA